MDTQSIASQIGEKNENILAKNRTENREISRSVIQVLLKRAQSHEDNATLAQFSGSDPRANRDESWNAYRLSPEAAGPPSPVAERDNDVESTSRLC